MDMHAPRLGRQRILEVAEELFTEHGFQAVSIRDIAQACEVTNAALYYHFPSKSALFDEVMQQHTTAINARMRQAAERPGRARERLMAVLTEYGTIVGDRRSPVFLLRREAEGISKEHFHQQLQSLLEATLGPLDAIMAAARFSGEMHDLPEGYSPAAMLVGMLHGLVQHRIFCLGGKVTKDDIRVVVDLFWDGAGKQE